MPCDPSIRRQRCQSLRSSQAKMSNLIGKIQTSVRACQRRWAVFPSLTYEHSIDCEYKWTDIHTQVEEYTAFFFRTMRPSGILVVRHIYRYIASTSHEHHMCAWCLRRLEESIGSPRPGVTDSCVPPNECWEPTPDLLQEQPTLTNSGPSLQPQLQPGFWVLIKAFICQFMTTTWLFCSRCLWWLSCILLTLYPVFPYLSPKWVSLPIFYRSVLGTLICMGDEICVWQASFPFAYCFNKIFYHHFYLQ